jgi:serine/threonine protein kinase
MLIAEAVESSGSYVDQEWAQHREHSSSIALVLQASNIILPEHVELVPHVPARHSFNTDDLVVGGKYKIVRPFASSSLTEVYEAVDTEDGERVALKIFHEKDDKTQDRVDRELITHVALSNTPGVVSVRDAGVLEEKGPSRYMVTEYANGGSQAVYMKQNPRDIDSLMRMASDVTTALAEVHELGAVHHDIKPANILVMSDRGADWKITDFGVVHGSPKADQTGLSDLPGDWKYKPGSVFGTVGYIAPEKVHGEEGAGDPKIDVYALGATMYKMATDEAPFMYDGFDDYADKIVNETPVRIDELNRAVPAALGKLIEACMSRSPINRPTTNELSLALKEI